jgi:hypothetical protein
MVFHPCGVLYQTFATGVQVVADIVGNVPGA